MTSEEGTNATTQLQSPLNPYDLMAQVRGLLTVAMRGDTEYAEGMERTFRMDICKAFGVKYEEIPLSPPVQTEPEPEVPYFGNITGKWHPEDVAKGLVSAQVNECAPPAYGSSIDPLVCHWEPESKYETEETSPKRGREFL